MVQDVLNSLHHLCLVQRRILPLQLYQLEPEQALRQKLRRSFTAGMREAENWYVCFSYEVDLGYLTPCPRPPSPKEGSQGVKSPPFHYDFK